MDVTFNYRKWAEDNEVSVRSYDVHSDLSVTVNQEKVELMNEFYRWISSEK